MLQLSDRLCLSELSLSDIEMLDVKKIPTSVRIRDLEIGSFFRHTRFGGTAV
jgi:hypothetical protein